MTENPYQQPLENPYQAPLSDVAGQPAGGGGTGDFSIGAAIGEAWEQTHIQVKYPGSGRGDQVRGDGAPAAA